jgi:drug/metabolite transporter (DMT)-like permease
MRPPAEQTPRHVPIETWALLYFLVYVPYAVIVRWLSTIPYPPLGRPLTGLEILPATTILCGVGTLVFAWASGWLRHVHRIRLFGMSIPSPTRWTFASGIGTALLLFTVPLSFTFQGISIPFMQLLMRGDVLVIAPLVDLMAGRRVRWYSWVALALVSIGLFLTIRTRGGLRLSPLAIVTVVLYTIGYFVRLAVMTRVGKTGDPDTVKAYFVEEKIVAIPVAVLALALLSMLHFGAQGGQLGFGFVGVWSSNQLIWMVVLAVLLVLTSIVAILILMDKRENTFCVPLERSASVLAGIAAAFVLAYMSLGPLPTPAELMGAGLLIVAIFVLSLGRRFSAGT